MKMVSAAKLRRAQEAIIAARPYTQALSRVVSELSAVAGPDAHPLFEHREAKAGEKLKVAIVAFSSDRGLAGGLNSNVIKAVERFAKGEGAGAEVSLRLIGRKANQHFSRRALPITSFDNAPTGATALTVARETATRIIDDFLEGKVDRVFMVYNGFKNAASQEVTMTQVLPVQATATAESPSDGGQGPDYIYEPSKEALLARLVPQFVQISLYRAALESIASEFGARMTAMENATKNAGEIISSLTLQYNRARQAAITKELLEIIGGAEALKG
jgi:F-type H+-transporting ATPase subunit gamma